MGPDLEYAVISGDTSACPRASQQIKSSQHGLERKLPFREKARLLLESPKFHIAVLTLVVAELSMVVVELMIDASGVEKSWALEAVELTLKYASIAILSLFVLENLFTVYVLRCEFFRKCLEVFDTAVVVTSLVLEVYFLHRHDAANGVGILIALRLWRIVRVVNGIAVTVTAQSERKLDEERELREEAQSELRECVCARGKQQRYILQLEEFIRAHDLPVPPQPGGPP
ncbi:voltage-gated hydrogen channel 1-like [Bacillus rossius redtenbacheri]|uniref:voltage-gated hydrogen channel 1-like n=1 Tax=Bacillus rossius redtenbacheri TaxID=93214 RepID=UPI002FDD6FFE